MYEKVVILMLILKGSWVEYEYNFGDGFVFVIIKNNIVVYMYRKFGVFNVLVIVCNGFGMVVVYLNLIVEVGKLCVLL